jgi:predicted TIM-barrel fold metal-dependent hydrolase
VPFGWQAQSHLDAANLLELREELDALRIPFTIAHTGRVDAAGGLDQLALRALLKQIRREQR